jgi:hypothetical protein
VVMNLAANARDARLGGGTLTIETATVRVDESYIQRHSIVLPGNYVLLTVTDTGQGIAAKHLAHIFEPFYTTKEAGKGTGLGLATVYGIVKQNGGFVWVYSEPGLGWNHFQGLPAPGSVATLRDITKPVESSPRGRETLLLVEDEASVRQASRQFLIRSGSHRAGSDPWRRRDPRVARAPRPDSLAGHGCGDAQNGWTDAGGAIDG